jgi:hypothetical protein
MQLESNDKIRIFNQNIIVACTGSVGYSQRLHDHVDMAIKGGVFLQKNRRECFANISSRMLKDLQASVAQFHPQAGLGFGAILACVHQDTPYLVEYGPKDFQHEEKDGRTFFVSMGSGQLLADPFLAFVNRVLWNGAMPTIEFGRLGVYWTLDQTIKCAAGGIGGKIRVATLRKIDGKWIASEMLETEEPAQFIDEIEAQIAVQARRVVDDAKTSPPPIPPSGP